MRNKTGATLLEHRLYALEQFVDQESKDLTQAIDNQEEDRKGIERTLDTALSIGRKANSENHLLSLRVETLEQAQEEFGKRDRIRFWINIVVLIGAAACLIKWLI